MNKTLEGLMEYIDKSVTAFHAVKNAEDRLLEAGYIKLVEEEEWKLEAGGKYFVTRNGSALIAFRLPKSEYRSFMITASHSDSPCFKLKDNAEIKGQGHYTKLSAEVYGGMINAPWLDIPLSIAGRVMIRTSKGVKARLIDFKRPMAIIPNLAVHMNRKVNEGYEYKKNVDLVPLYGDENATDLNSLIAKELNVNSEDILGRDLFLYNPMKCTEIGNGEFFSGPRLDDLECAYTCLKGFIGAKANKKSIVVYTLYDNEEVGSLTRAGAASTFMKDVLKRINSGLGYDSNKYKRALSQSLLLSADNAHAVHPNFPDICDANNKVYMNGGIVIKFHASQKYATDGLSASLFKCICDKKEIPYQTYFNRSDMPGGSTLGNLSNAQVALATVDIGLPQLAMHSSFETAGTKDPEYMVKLLEYFYSISLCKKDDEIFFE